MKTDRLKHYFTHFGFNLLTVGGAISDMTRIRYSASLGMRPPTDNGLLAEHVAGSSKDHSVRPKSAAIAAKSLGQTMHIAAEALLVALLADIPNV
jgi:hypothetical protein